MTHGNCNIKKNIYIYRVVWIFNLIKEVLTSIYKHGAKTHDNLFQKYSLITHSTFSLWKY